MTNIVKIGDKYVGDGEKTFITFEAGPTHNGLESAKLLVKHAAEAGGDAVKFQIFDPDELVADKELMYSYDVLIDKQTGKTETVSESLYEIFKRRSMSESSWKELKKYADDLGLTFFATIGDESGFELVKSIGCHSIKIASADVNYLPWLRKIAKLGVSLQLDTGNATFGEIEQAVDVIKSEGNDQIIIHNCPSGYPAHLDSINLNMLPNLKNIFKCPVAYSDHSPGETMDVAAIALGANLVEKTITEDKMTRSVEHVMSIEPHEMKKFVDTIRDVERAMGEPRRIMTDHEKQKRLNARRSAILDEAVTEGQTLSSAKVKFKRPGYGVAPDQYEKMVGMSFNKALPKGHVLSVQDLS
ncbi:N-acetylneuraminate synthase [Vreelandella subterranea]|uniref:N-acetylneuraminate synthase n=1 Tax=Vreelandella subterranea TaxID=416874 RepID=A0A1H9WLE5_9GAMM|nr:N-acetylneuraminate synthase family protein [Halomonas subterranea]SES34732.1 N-acetylneuraminate synthase [Halomonas subterranea]